MSAASVVALLGVGGVGLAAVVFLAYKLSQAGDRLDKKGDALIAEMRLRFDAQTKLAASEANLVAIAAERDALKAALAAARATAKGEIEAAATATAKELKDASGPDLVGVVSGELVRPLPGTAAAAGAAAGGQGSPATGPAVQSAGAAGTVPVR